MSDLLKRSGQVPRYTVIASALRSDIEEGRLPAGVQFPSERKLMTRFGVSRSTVRAAISQLRSEGMVVVEKGAGSFVRDPGRDRCQIDARVVGMWLGEVGERPFKLSSPEPHVSRELAGDVLAGRLGIPADAKVLQQEILGPGPDITRQWTRATLHPETEQYAQIRERDMAHDELPSVLSSKGVSIESIDDEVEARMPTPEEREKLGILDGVPVLDVVRMIRAAGRTAAVIETVVAADLVSLRYSLPLS
ncbi:MAG: GntR family transcriptional regulator [Candidatus Dormiibacterota bacterium]